MTQLRLSNPEYWDDKDYLGRKPYGFGHVRPYCPLNWDAFLKTRTERHTEPQFIELESLTFAEDSMLAISLIVIAAAVVIGTFGLALLVTGPALYTEWKSGLDARQQHLFLTLFEGAYRGYAREKDVDASIGCRTSMPGVGIPEVSEKNLEAYGAWPLDRDGRELFPEIAESGQPLPVQSYGCALCQKQHFEDTQRDLFVKHLRQQSKDGVQWLSETLEERAKRYGIVVGLSPVNG